MPSNDLQKCVSSLSSKSHESHSKRAHFTDSIVVIRSTCHSIDRIENVNRFGFASNSMHIHQIAGWPDPYTHTRRFLRMHNCTLAWTPCNAFWQCGNNQIINANFHMELHLHRNGTLIRHICLLPLTRLRLLFFFHALRSLKAVLFVSASFIVAQSIHASTFSPYTDFSLEFQNYSHVLIGFIQSADLFEMVHICVQPHTHTHANSQWSHKSCYRWLCGNQATDKKIHSTVRIALISCRCFYCLGE